MDSVYKALADLETKGEAGVLCTIVRSQGSTPRHTGSKMLVYPDGRFIGSVGGGEVESRVLDEAKLAFADNKPRLLEYNMSDPARGDPGVCGGQVEIFVEPILPKPMVVVIGCGHVGNAVAHLAKWLGFCVAVSDDRAEFCTPEAIPGADGYYPMSMEELPQALKITPWSYVILTTRGVVVDVAGLPALLETPAAFIGVIGSQRRWATTCEQLLAMGIPPEKMARLTSPIGLPIHAETPEEIAVSVLGQIIQLHRERVSLK